MFSLIRKKTARDVRPGIALLKVHTDLAKALDERSITGLIMLDLYAVFYVIEYPILY